MRSFDSIVLQILLFFTFIIKCTTPAFASNNFYFYDSISENTILSYISRTIHWTPPYNDVSLDRYVKRVGFDKFFSETVGAGAKMILQAENTWRDSAITPADIEKLSPVLSLTHNKDPETIFNVFIAERVNKDYVNGISIPKYVFDAFNIPTVNRNFDYDLMFNSSWPYINIWGANNSAPDITQLETQMWYYYYSTLYINAGFESIWLGQIYVTAKSDIGYTETHKLVQKIREYGSEHARRKYIIVISHQLGDVLYEGQPIFDHLFYITHFGLDSNNNMKAYIPSNNWINCDLYASACEYYSRHALSENMPLLLMFDNGGSMHDPHHPQLNGFDPITYFATRPKSQRHEYLLRISTEVKEQYHKARFAPPTTMLATFTTDRRLCPDDNGVYQLPFANDYEATDCGDLDVIHKYFSFVGYTAGDFDNNGIVNIQDFNILLQSFGKIYNIFHFNDLVTHYPQS